LHKAVVVGAGPAGIAAAGVLVQAGLDVVLVDEGRNAGGQIHRAPSAGLAIDMRRLLRGGHAAYEGFHAAFDAIRHRLDYRPETLVWNIHGREAYLATRTTQASVAYDVLILATGATDRVMPMSGWTLPGVFTLGGTQALLKDQGCLVGRNVVFAGSSPLLYLAALQYRRMGGTVAAVIDTTPFTGKLRALTDMLAAPAILAKGLTYMAALRRLGVPIIHGARLDRVAGTDHVEAIEFRTRGGSARRVACDSVAYGHGLRAETQLAELAGCQLRYDAVHRQYLPVADIDGRAGEGIYLAGDGSAIGGAEAAALSGTLAGAAILHDLGLALAIPDIAAHRRDLARLRRFQRGLATAFAWPHRLAADLPDAVPVCRCEHITAGEVRQALRQTIGASEVNRVKAATRCGMGRCQGRFCGLAAAELTAAVMNRPDAPLDRLRAQPPVKPLPIGSVSGTPL
jgi:NADPH-dependent 2,4-dienoyl-CoA reductase/sulfur reductase-like enzyme